MIILNGKQFAKNDDEFTNSLFKRGGTCVGFYKANKRSVTLYDMQRNKIGVINRYGVLASATKQNDGKYWYSYATPKVIGEYDYKQQRAEVEAIMEAYNIY
jgi:hypothetical protein